MKRTKQANDPKPMRRTKEPDTLPDGRVLGRKMADMVPKHLQDVIPSAPVPKTRGRKRKAIHQINMLCRTRMPLSLTPDGELAFEDKKVRLKGINQAKFNALIAGIKSGMRMNQAARLVGINPDTIKQWMKRGEKGEHPYTLVACALREAEAELEQSLLESIRQAGTVTLKYDEITEEETVDDHGNRATKTVRKTKVKFPQFQAAAWILERTRPEIYRSDREVAGVDEINIELELQAMRQISDMMEDGGQDSEQA